MHVEQTGLPGLLLIEPKCFRDARGFFLESFQDERYRAAGIAENFVQQNHSHSTKGVLRGLHFTVKNPQAQLVTVMHGCVFDVAVDLRPDSPTFGRWYGAQLSEDRPRQLYMAPGFGHGFCVLSDTADLHYNVSRIYDHDDEGGVVWNDPQIGIKWPIENPIISPRDGGYPSLRELGRKRLPHVVGAGGEPPVL